VNTQDMNEAWLIFYILMS